MLNPNTNNGNLKVFSLNANPILSVKVAEQLGIKLSEASVKTFADGEIQIDIKESIRNDIIFIIQSTSTPVNDNIMELLIFVDALKRASSKEINVVMPYYGYSRQERKTKSRQPISAKLVANIIERAGVDRLITVDLHAPQIQGFFDIPTDHLTAGIIVADHLKKLFPNPEEIVIVSPDHGGVRRARKVSQTLDCSLAIIDKRRPRPNEAEIQNIIGDINGKTAIMVDDMVDTAGTLCVAADALLEKGAKEVYAVCIHGILSLDAIEKIEKSNIKKLFVTNSVERDLSKSTKIEVIDIS